MFLKKKVTEADIEACLSGIDFPDTISTSVQVKNDTVLFVLEGDPKDMIKAEQFRAAAEENIRAVKGVKSVTAVMTAKTPPGANTGVKTAVKTAVKTGEDVRIPVMAQSVAGKKTPAKAPIPLSKMPDVKHIIAVASGKGGVGKSTVAANLAVALSQSGLKVGLMDADIYGPSMPRMMGIKDNKPEVVNGLLEPQTAHGLKIMSMGFMVEEETPMIWRGPMIQSALRQFLEDVDWGALDIMVVDLPPGTGDAQLTMAQKVPLSGAIIVSTPQDIALIDARKGLFMFEKVGIPVLGIIENMSQFVCPNCDHETHIFGHGGARDEAAKLECDFLAEIPLELSVREQSDKGAPIVVSNPDSNAAKIFRDIASQIKTKLESIEAPAEPAVKIKT